MDALSVDRFAAWLEPFLGADAVLVLPLVIVGGLVTAVNPCCLPLYPAVFGYLGYTATDQPGTARSTAQTTLTLLFVLGMASATTLMGMLTASAGWVFGQFPPAVRITLAAIPLVMGLHLLDLLPLRLPTWQLHPRAVPARSGFPRLIVAYAAGLMFSLVLNPCATPILIGILTHIALQGDPIYGSVLMFIYSLGAGLPLLLIGLGFARWHRYFAIAVHQRRLRFISGALLVGVGIYSGWMAL